MSAKLGKGLLLVVDLKGSILKVASKRNMAILKQLISQLGPVFPGLVEQVLIINAPMLFSDHYAAIRAMVDKSEWGKISLLGTGYLKELNELVELGNIPQSVGGKCVCDDVDCLPGWSGPWQDELNEEFRMDVEEDEPELGDLKNILGSLVGPSKKHDSLETPVNTLDQ